MSLSVCRICMSVLTLWLRVTHIWFLEILPSLYYHLYLIEELFSPYLSNIIVSLSRIAVLVFLCTLLRSDTSASHILLFLVFWCIVVSTFSMHSLVYIKLCILNKKGLISFDIHSYKIEISSHYCTRAFLYKKRKFIIHIYYVKFFAKDDNIYK